MMSRRGGDVLAAVALASGLAWGCGGDEPAATAQAPAQEPALPAAANQAPVVERVALDPRDPVVGQTIRATVQASDANGDPVRMFYSWSVNGTIVEVGASPAFLPKELRSGDRVAVEVVASDGRLESDPARAWVSAANRAPFIRVVTTAPGDPTRPGQDLEAQVDAEDPDGDPLQLEYTWFVNGESQGRGEKTLATDRLRRGDKVRVRVVARDSRDRSKPMESEEIELANSPPVFAGVPPREEVDGVLFYKLEARDPDGDRSLRFRLVEGPPGMSIDPMTGVVRWQPQAAHAGVHPVEVVVRDRLGDESFLRWNLNVSVSRQEAPAAAAP